MKARWLVASLVSVALALPSLAGERVTLYLFNSRGCINCIHEEQFLAGLRQRIPELDVRPCEVVSDPANAKLLVTVAAAFGVQARGVPVSFIGPLAPIEGYESDETTGRLIEERVRACLARGCEDVVGPLVGNNVAQPAAGAGSQGKGIAPFAAGTVEYRAGSGQAAPSAGAPEAVLSLPLLGRMDLSTMPLLALTVVLGALDSPLRADAGVAARDLAAGDVPRTVVPALAANTYELLCTAGFPLIFTRILTLSRLEPGGTISTWRCTT